MKEPKIECLKKGVKRGEGEEKSLSLHFGIGGLIRTGRRRQSRQQKGGRGKIRAREKRGKKIRARHFKCFGSLEGACRCRCRGKEGKDLRFLEKQGE